MTVAQPVRLALVALAGALVLLWAEMLLTAAANSPNTWVGAVSSTGILAVAGVLALVCAASADRRPAGAGTAAALGAVAFSLPFWAGGAIVLGATAYVLNRKQRRGLALLGAALAVLQLAFLVVSVVLDFAPGLPA